MLLWLACVLAVSARTAGGAEQGNAQQDVSQPRGEEVQVRIEPGPFNKRTAVVRGAALQRANGRYDGPVAVPGYDGPTVFHDGPDEDDLYIYRWHQHHWVVGEMNHHRGGPADGDDSAVPLGALYVARGSEQAHTQSAGRFLCCYGLGLTDCLWLQRAPADLWVDGRRGVRQTAPRSAGEARPWTAALFPGVGDRLPSVPSRRLARGGRAEFAAAGAARAALH